MLSFYKNLPIATKLFLSNLAFALPVVVLIFFMNISFTHDINIGKKEGADGGEGRPGLFSHYGRALAGSLKERQEAQHASSNA